jgi:hypothetical protein
MSVPLELKLDAEGRPRARWPWSGPAEAVLPEFLEVDVGMHGAYGREIVREGRRVLQGRSPRWKASGNAFGLEIEADLTTIERLVDDPRHVAVQLSTRDFVGLVERWCRLVDGGGRRGG